MSRRKDESKEEHAERCEAIVEHMAMATALRDVRFAESARQHEHRLDSRRKVPWERGPDAIRYGLESYAERIVGSHYVDFDAGYSEGMRYTVYVRTDDDTERVAIVPVPTHYSAKNQHAAFIDCEDIALTIAGALEARARMRAGKE